jgi:hypothetical protein
MNGVQGKSTDQAVALQALWKLRKKLKTNVFSMS